MCGHSTFNDEVLNFRESPILPIIAPRYQQCNILFSCYDESIACSH